MTAYADHLDALATDLTLQEATMNRRQDCGQCRDGDCALHHQDDYDEEESR